MSTNERYTHFQGFARLQIDDLESLFGNLSDAEEHYDPRLIALCREAIIRYLARSGYELLYFLLDKAPYHSGSFDTGYGTPEEIHETIAHLPDLDAWPPTTAESPTAE